jgi:hypothetical protein
MNPSMQVFMIQLGFLTVVFFFGRNFILSTKPLPLWKMYTVYSGILGIWVCFGFILYLKYVVGT